MGEAHTAGELPNMRYAVAGVRHATAEHVKLLMESQIAVIERDTARDETLEAAIADAGQKRESARTAIREHEAAAHEKKSS